MKGTSMSRAKLLVMAGGLVVLLMAASARADYTENLAGWWNFDASGGSQVDSSSNGNTGTLVGGVWQSSYAGRTGVIYFDGNDDYVQVLHSASLSLTANLTITAWVNVADLSVQRSIISKTGNNIYTEPYWNHPAPYDFYLTNGTGNQALLRGNGYYTNTKSATGTSGVSLNDWHHVAVSMSGTSVAFYIDGVAAGTGTINTTMGDAGGPVYIGNRRDQISGGSGPMDFNGYLDDVRIYNTALSQSEIQSVIPEPGSILLVVSGALFLASRRRHV